MNVIFTCGGTGGHINPAIAVANIFKERHPDCNILFIGASGEMEEKLVPMAGYKLIGLPSSGLTRSLSLNGLKRNVDSVRKLINAMKTCKQIFEEFKPDVIVGTGGYASFPALYMGSKMGIPICVHESNATPGLTTRMIAKRADRILVSFEDSARHYAHKERVEVVGMPVRREFIYTDKEEARKELGLDQRPLVVSAFGSLGAMDMNCIMADLFKLEKDEGMPFQHIHATGSFGWRWMPALVREVGVDPEDGSGLDMREYIYNMPTVMAAADVFIGRSGASSCNEIAASGTPCILIPSPNVTDNHQEKNARVYEKNGAATVILEKECGPQVLMDKIMELLQNQEKSRQMSAALRKIVVLNSAERICDIMEDLAKH